MKFLKQQNTSRFNVSDNTIIANGYGRVIMDAQGGLLLPKGTTAQRPQTDGVHQPTNAYGTIRYNTETNDIEAFIDGEDGAGGTWEIVKSASKSTITKQTLGPSDGIQTMFGPLLAKPQSDDNILVLVENVLQISETNYNVVENSGAWYIEFTEPVPAVNAGSGNPIYITIFYGFSN